MSELFSHQEQGGDDAVAEKQAPSGVIFLEPAGSATQAEPEPSHSRRRPDEPDFS
jgi:hypothetical protein